MAPASNVKTGRNAPCPCGSGKKFKNCCQNTLAPPPNAPNTSAARSAPSATEIGELAALLNAGQDAAVERYSRELVERYPSEGPIWKVLGQTLLRQGKDARGALRRATALLSGDPEAHSNLGIALRRHGELDAAVASCRRAVAIKPDYAEAHSNLGNALRDLRRLDEAVASFRRSLEIDPGLAGVHSNLGNALRDLGQHAAAVASYRRALAISPDFAEAHNNLGIALQGLGRSADAVVSYRRALEISPDFAEAHSNLGNALRDLGQLEAAVASYRRALAIKPDYADGHSNLGSVLMHLGNTDEAQGFLTKAIELSAGGARALATALVYIPYQRDDPRFDRLKSVYTRRASLPLEDRIQLCFSMGKAMETVGQFDGAFDAYAEGNLLHHRVHPFDEAADERYLAESRSAFTPQLLEACVAPEVHLPLSRHEPVPIFIVGMPRSGTTLIEQILASHPAVFGAGELTKLGELAGQAARLSLDTPQREASLSALRILGRAYMDHVSRVAPGASYITDKMPANYRCLALIRLMLPDARIIHSVRDAMDTCFSCYALRFRSGHEYSYDLGMLGRHYLRYRQLMQHWYQVLGAGRILNVRYEDTVADPEGEARRLLDGLGLAWDPACLRFYETERAVSTASVAQVRRPIYSSSVGRWRNFERHLAPLLDAVRLALVPDEADSGV
jgi:tetratricopeptide (TPR) repeat protein